MLWLRQNIFKHFESNAARSTFPVMRLQKLTDRKRRQERKRLRRREIRIRPSILRVATHIFLSIVVYMVAIAMTFRAQGSVSDWVGFSIIFVLTIVLVASLYRFGTQFNETTLVLNVDGIRIRGRFHAWNEVSNAQVLKHADNRYEYMKLTLRNGKTIELRDENLPITLGEICNLINKRT